MTGRYEGGTAVYDVIRDCLRDGMPRTVEQIVAATGYSAGYVRKWLGMMSDVGYAGNRGRAYRYKIMGERRQ
jgi:hypothetical protein